MQYAEPQRWHTWQAHPQSISSVYSPDGPSQYSPNPEMHCRHPISHHLFRVHLKVYSGSYSIRSRQGCLVVPQGHTAWQRSRGLPSLYPSRPDDHDYWSRRTCHPYDAGDSCSTVIGIDFGSDENDDVAGTEWSIVSPLSNTALAVRRANYIIQPPKAQIRIDTSKSYHHLAPFSDRHVSLSHGAPRAMRSILLMACAQDNG